MTEILISYPSKAEYNMALALAKHYNKVELETLVSAKGYITGSMSLTERKAVVAEIAKHGLVPRKQYKRDKNFEHVFEVFENVRRPTGNTVTDTFGNTVPGYETLTDVYVYSRWNGDEDTADMLATVSIAGGTVVWRSDNTDGPDGTPEPMADYYPRIA